MEIGFYVFLINGGIIKSMLLRLIAFLVDLCDSQLIANGTSRAPGSFFYTGVSFPVKATGSQDSLFC